MRIDIRETATGTVGGPSRLGQMEGAPGAKGASNSSRPEDEVRLSGILERLSAAVQGGPVHSPERISAIAAAIHDGSYKVDPTVLADRLIEASTVLSEG